jgi:hypothetical protein
MRRISMADWKKDGIRKDFLFDISRFSILFSSNLFKFSIFSFLTNFWYFLQFHVCFCPNKFFFFFNFGGHRLFRDQSQSIDKNNWARAIIMFFKRLSIYCR